MSSKIKSRNRLLSSHKKSSFTKLSTKDELLVLKYSMDRPSLPIYSLEDPSRNDVPGSSKGNGDGVKDSFMLTYPDYIPWKDHTQTIMGKRSPDHQEPDNHNYLSKGYFEAPHVGNEYHSGRNLVSATLFKSNENCLSIVNELSQYLTNAYRTRNENINKIRFNSGHFKIPQKVTLTATKRENWLNDLSNPNMSLKKIGEKIPHGIRSKVLIDSLCTRSTPIDRALWFTKCVLFSELLALRRKYQSKLPPDSSSPEKFELHWLQEWTQQVASYVFKMAQDIMQTTDGAKKDTYMKKLGYLRELISSLYVETLLDKTYFLSLILKPLRDGFPTDSDAVSELIKMRQSDEAEDYDASIQEDLQCDINYSQRFGSLVWIKTFWNDIIGIDYLAKELGESLLLNYFYITKLSQYPKWFLPEHLRDNLTKSFSDMVVFLFKYNTNVFVIPNNWAITGDSLATILLQETFTMHSSESKKITDQLELINYRNESLIINMSKHETAAELSNNNGPPKPIVPVYGNAQNFSSDKRYRGAMGGMFKVLQDLDQLRFNGKIIQRLQPRLGNQNNDNWKQILRTVLFWCVSPWRYSEFQHENILVVCNFLKRALFAQADKTTKVELENEILESIFVIIESERGLVDSNKLYILINELYQLKIVTIASYIRKLIASGVFYTTPGEHSSQEDGGTSTQNHLQCLMNLPVLNNRQCDSILRKWTTDGPDFKATFDLMKGQLQSEILDRVFTNREIILTHQFEDNWNSLRVGLKFLLVNWLTDEFKEKLTSTPKLIVLTPDALSKMYKFYAISDNLPVFFKIVVQAILRNESRMAILYLDGLYFISRLIMRHFKLIKQFADSSNRPTVANLFRLVIQSYKDLCQREFVLYDFHQVWNFVDSVTEKDELPCRKRKWDARSSAPQFGIQSVRKDTYETPMQIQSVDLALDHTPRLTDAYSSDDFRNDLAALRSSKTIPLTEAEVKELKGIVGADDPESYLNNWFLKVDSISEILEVAIVKLWKHLTIGVDIDKMSNLIRSVLLDVLNSDRGLNRKVLMIKKLIIYDIISFCDFVSLMDSNKMDADLLLHQMLLEPNFSDNSELSASQYQLFNIHVHFFKDKNKQQFTNLFLSGLRIGNLQSSGYFIEHREMLKRYLSQNLVTHDQYIFNELFAKISREDCFELLNLCLHRSGKTSIVSLSDFEKNIEEVNEFNLPFFQALLCVVARAIDTEDKAATKARWEEFITIFLNKPRSIESPESFIFGGLFFRVPWEHKLIVMEILEEKIFTQTSIDNTSITLSVNGVDLSRIITGFLDIFLSNAVSTVDSPRSFITNFTELLSKIEHIINKEIPDECRSTLNTFLSIILKVLIIHKPSLCTFIATNLSDELVNTFVKKLTHILNSRYIKSENEKLRVLFHDLLLLMKSSVTEKVTELVEQNLLTSLGSPEQQSPGGNRHKESTMVESTATTSQVQRLFDIPELDKENPFKGDFNDGLVSCAIMLGKEDLVHGGDSNHINDNNLKLQIPKSDALNIPAFVGNILGNEKTEDQDGATSKVCVRPFKVRSYELLEDTSYSLNDGCINLSLFDAYVAKANPP